MRSTGFEHQHRFGRILGEATGKHEAGRAASYDDVVEVVIGDLLERCEGRGHVMWQVEIALVWLGGETAPWRCAGLYFIHTDLQSVNLVNKFPYDTSSQEYMRALVDTQAYDCRSIRRESLTGSLALFEVCSNPEGPRA